MEEPGVPPAVFHYSPPWSRSFWSDHPQMLVFVTAVVGVVAGSAVTLSPVVQVILVAVAVVLVAAAQIRDTRRGAQGKAEIAAWKASLARRSAPLST